MTLYLKYRPKNLDELDLVAVSESLKKIVSSGNIPHALLFSGPKGTGKTSAARILAKIVNCEHLKGSDPCNKCDMCVSIANGSNLDVIELDAASHRGIDDVRTLRDAVKLAPSRAKKKVYIIDEAHMLTTEASNALLKTLEEPPSHVIFILATTNPEKLIDTIRSRTTNVLFKKATTLELVRSLKRVVTGEKIKIKDETLEKIASQADGSFRDAIKILEQVVSEGEEYLLINKSFDSAKFVELLTKKDVGKLIKEIEKMVTDGFSIEIFMTSLMKLLQKELLGETKFNKNELINLLDLLIEASKNMSDSLIEELPLELAIIKWCGDGEMEDSERKMVNGDDQTPDSDFQSPITNFSVNDDAWQKILSIVKPINASVEALLRSAKPVAYDGKVLTLGVFYKFHKERLEDAHHRVILETTIAQVLNSPTKVVCTLLDPPIKVIPVLTETKDSDIIKAAEELFSN